MGYGWDIYIYKNYGALEFLYGRCSVYTCIYIYIMGSDQPYKWDESRTTASGSRIG